MLKVKLAHVKALQRLAKELPKRSAAIRRNFVYSAATRVHEELLKRIPSDTDYTKLRESLEVVRAKHSAPIYAVRALPPKTRVDALKADAVVIYIRVSSKNTRIPKEIRILEKHSPWTLETLPFKPLARYATMLHRRASTLEVHRVARLREADRNVWQPALNAAGVPRRPRTEEGKQVLQGDSASDVVFESLSLEFGMGRQSVPHWRPAVRSILSGAFSKEFKKRPDVRKTLSDGRFAGWRKYNQLGAASTASVTELSEYEQFQARLGILA